MSKNLFETEEFIEFVKFINPGDVKCTKCTIGKFYEPEADKLKAFECTGNNLENVSEIFKFKNHGGGINILGDTTPRPFCLVVRSFTEGKTEPKSFWFVENTATCYNIITLYKMLFNKCKYRNENCDARCTYYVYSVIENWVDFPYIINYKDTVDSPYYLINVMDKKLVENKLKKEYIKK